MTGILLLVVTGGMCSFTKVLTLILYIHMANFLFSLANYVFLSCILGIMVGTGLRTT